MPPKRQGPADRRLLQVEVVRSERISPHFVRVTFGGEDLADFRPMGADQWGRLFFRREGQEPLRLPTSSGSGWFAQCLLMGQATRPWIRNYTVRAFRPEALEFDVEFVVHGDGDGHGDGHGDAGPGSGFASRAVPGEPVGFLDEGISHVPPDGARQLLVADESAVPAALAVLESARADTEGLALLEVPSEEDVREVRAPSGMDVRWLPRTGADTGTGTDTGNGSDPGRLALEALTEAALPDAPYYAWIAGESGLATGARRFLNRERGVPKSAISFIGYWRTGRSSPG
ncbi:siderophore-interacting protein [Streptomyces sp. O3]